jgi:hypothetical protein
MLARVRAAIGVLLAAALSAPDAARAADPGPRTSSLSWVRLAGAESCAGVRDVADAVERRLGRPVFEAPARADRALEGRIERASPSGGWRAVITLSDEHGVIRGTRELHTDEPDCRALDDSIALALALMIDPDAALSPLPPRAPPPVPPPPALPPAPRCDPVPPPPPPPPPARPWRAGAQVGFTVGLGMLPRAGAGVAMRLHVVPPRGPAFEVGGTIWIEQTDTPAGKLGATFDLAYGSLSICPVALGDGATTFFACAGAQLGSLRAAGIGFDHVLHQEQPIVDVTAEAHVRRALVGPLFAALGLGLVVPTFRYRFDVFDTQDLLFQPSPVAGTVEAAFGLSFR